MLLQQFSEQKRGPGVRVLVIRVVGFRDVLGFAKCSSLASKNGHFSPKIKNIAKKSRKSCFCSSLASKKERLELGWL